MRLGFCIVCATCFAPIAKAQGSVTLYGLIDESIEVTNPGSSWTPRLDSGAYRGSRFGIRGVEALGDGNQLLFDLEEGFNLSNGAQATTNLMFSRQAWIGSRGDWGELRLGRQYSPLYIPFKGQLDAFSAGTIASGLNNLSKITPYVDDALTYLSPNLSGFTATVMYALRDPSVADGNGIGGIYTTLRYGFGPFRINYAYQQTHGSAALRANLAGISYGIDRLRAYVAIFNGEGGGAPDYHADGLSVSTSYDFTASLNASIGYTHLRDRSGSDNNADQFSASAQYSFSKTVSVYFSVADLLNRNAAIYTLRGVNVTGLSPAYPGAPIRGFQLGMIERF